MLTKSKKHSDTSPVCQRHRIAVLSCFILPGLPSQALARQLSQRESPWQRGFVFDETDLRLLENVTECQSLPLSGEVASSEAKMSERLYRAAPALFRSLERRPLSNLSVSHPLDSRSPFGTCVPPPPAGGVFPGRGALGKEVSFRSNTRCCDKTSPPQSLPLSGKTPSGRREMSRSDRGRMVARRRRDGEVWPAPPAKASPLWERWHGEAVTERARMLTKSKKHSDTSPVCQKHRIAVLSCFILPGLPSQALARQLSQRESPWQGGQALVYASMPWSAGG